MIFSVILWGTGVKEVWVSVGEAPSHSLDFAIVLSHFVFSSVILWFSQLFYDFLSYFVRHRGGRGMCVGGRGAQLFFEFWHSGQSIKIRGWTGPSGRRPAGLPANRAWQAARAAHCSHGPVLARHCAANFNSFSIILNFENCFKLPKFIETCRSVQKL
jgi:hypothetical protein